MLSVSVIDLKILVSNQNIRISLDLFKIIGLELTKERGYVDRLGSVCREME
jgi:hypothetical protein